MEKKISDFTHIFLHEEGIAFDIENIYLDKLIKLFHQACIEFTAVRYFDISEKKIENNFDN